MGRDIGIYKEILMQLKNEVYDPFEQAAIYYKFIPQFDSYLTANNIKIIWVSSYPRSGNRFFNTLLYFTLFPQNTDFSNFSYVMLDEHLLDKQRPYEQFFIHNINGQKLIFVKTHFPFNARHNLARHTYGAVHIYRNPFDVAISDFIMSEYNSICNDEKKLNLHMKNYFVYFSNFYLSPTSSLYGYSSWPEHYFSWKKLHLYSTIKFISLDYDFLCNDHSAFHICMKEFGINLTTTRLEEIYTLSSWSNAERFQRKMIEQNSEVGGFRDRQGNPMTHLTPKSVKEKVLRFALPYKQGLDEKFRAWTSII
mgnify:FL=1